MLSAAPIPLSIPTLIPSPGLAAQHPPISEIRLLAHRISAGFPSPAADYADEGLDLNSYLVRNKASTYFLMVRGLSVIEAGIFDGDIVAVDRSLEAMHKDLVVAVVDGEYTIKRLFQANGRIELHPENPDFEPIKFTDGMELQIWGVVIGVVRRFAARGSS
ncbi:MAG: translesion error-prone DNA polymerase V autoproteolytic subunit [Pseudomonadota bacterium]